MKRQRVRKTLLLLSFLVFTVTINYFSPYLIIQGGFEGVVSGSFIMFASMLVVSLFMGRAFCGWICPAGALQEVCAGIRTKPAGKRVRYIKYFIWVPWIASITAGFISAGGIKTIDPIYFTDHGISVSDSYGYIIYYSVILLILALAFFAGRRGFCHSVCWMAPFMIIGTNISRLMHLPRLHLESDSDKCKQCGKCTAGCPMSLPVNEMVQKGDMKNDECILCANCSDACPSKAVTVRFKRSRK